eukprot:m.44022 g.44022  ORF g.44022 m.44022 type:complete len:513 (+) comp10039_c0_seq1:34-1572(+)
MEYRVFLLLLLVGKCDTLPFPFSWDNLSTWCFPGHLSSGPNNAGFFTEEEVAHYAKFNLILFWGINLTQDTSKGPGWFIPIEESQSLQQAAAIKRINPNTRLFPYITGFMSQTWFKAQADFNHDNYSSYWLRDTKGNIVDCNYTDANPTNGQCYGYSQGAPGRLWDWRNPSVGQYFLDSVIAPYIDSEYMDGIFLDDTCDVANRCMANTHGVVPCAGTFTFSAQDQLDFANATLKNINAVLATMTAKNKTGIISSTARVDTFPINSAMLDSILQQHNAFHFIEFWTGSDTDIQTAIKITSAGIPLIVHASGNANSYFEEREYVLAAFLVSAGEYSYWNLGDGWSVNSFPWFPEYDRPLGKPLGPAISPTNGSYIRQFTALNVSINTVTKQAKITWHGFPPFPGPPPPPPPPPIPPFGKYNGSSEIIVHQNPPSYNLTKSVPCTGQNYSECVATAANACDTVAGCVSFSVITPAYDGRVFAQLSPLPVNTGQYNKWWNSYEKPTKTPGNWSYK